MGRQIAGLPPYRGGYAENPTLLFSWLFYRTDQSQWGSVLDFFRAQGDEDFLLSWADAYLDGLTPENFGSHIRLVQAHRMRPAVMLTSKGMPHDAASLAPLVDAVIPILRALRVPRVCIGWELNSFLSGEELQLLIDHVAPQIDWGAFLYVHFTEYYGAWPPNGLLFADFWKANVKKLRGVWHQKGQPADLQTYLTGEGGLRDILIHFANPAYGITDSGDGTPFDLVAFELDLDKVGHGTITEDAMHAIGRAAIALDPVAGPLGPVGIMGSGCGQ